jgi:hypothetical protein
VTSRQGARFAAGALGMLMLGFFTTSIGVQEVTNANGLTALHQLGLLCGHGSCLRAQPARTCLRAQAVNATPRLMLVMVS